MAEAREMKDPSSSEAGSTYEPRNVLVTGGAGFIASHVVLKLLREYPQYNVINLDKLDYCSSLANLQQHDVDSFPNYKFIRGNICSQDLVNYVFTQERIDTVLHFAAQTHVDNSFGNSFEFTRNNVMGTHVLLEAAKAHNIRRFIHVSTDEVYGEGADGEQEMVEERVLEPTNPYAATKAAAEFLVKAYHRSFNLPVIITRGNNVYGPHQFPEKLIPKFCIQLMRGRPVTLHGTGANTRNYLYVTDVADAFDTILHHGATGTIYNVGGSNEVSNLDVARTLIRLIRPDGEAAESNQEQGLTEHEKKHIEFVEDRCFNDRRYTIDSSRLKALGWVEKVSWQEGLTQTLEWYRLNHKNWSPELVEGALTAHPRMLGSTSRDREAAGL